MVKENGTIIIDEYEEMLKGLVAEVFQEEKENIILSEQEPADMPPEQLKEYTEIRKRLEQIRTEAERTPLKDVDDIVKYFFSEAAEIFLMVTVTDPEARTEENRTHFCNKYTWNILKKLAEAADELKAREQEGQPIKEKKRRRKPANKGELQAVGDFYNIPESAITENILKVMGAFNDISRINGRGNMVASINKTLNTIDAIIENGEAVITLQFEKADELTNGKPKQAKKLFVFSLNKINEQALYNGALTQGYISFPLQELVDSGQYGSLRAARRGFENTALILEGMKVARKEKEKKRKKNKKGEEENSKEKKSSSGSFASAVLFTGAYIKDNICVVTISTAVKWDIIAAFFTILPKYYFKLPNRAADLLYYIFYLARQNTDKIENGILKFNISMRKIQERLNLPSEIGNRRPQQTIKDPIEEAITAIEEENQDADFTITPYYSEEGNIIDYLEKGYLQIELKGKFIDMFKHIAEITKKRINERVRRGKAIVDKAKAINLAKSLAAEEADEVKENNII